MSDASLSEWAEDLTAFGHGARLTSGADAAASGRAMLETALGGPEAVERALRGRPVLSSTTAPHVRGYKSPQRTFRLPRDLDEKLTLLSAKQGRRQSDVVRDALAEYIERNSA